MTKNRRARCRGGSALEMAFFMPWFIFLFVGTLDWGFYSHALISTESAARVAALWTSKATGNSNPSPSNDAQVCRYVLGELGNEPNLGGASSCSASPLTVTYSVVDPGADGQPASQVAVTYQTINLIPIPGLLRSQTTIYRVVQMRLRS